MSGSRLKKAAAAASVALVSAPLLAQQAEDPRDPYAIPPELQEYRTRQGQIDAFIDPTSPMPLRVPIYESSSGFRFKLRGRVDYAVSDVDFTRGSFSDGPASARFRYARTGFEGDFENGINFRTEVDFVSGNVRIIDALVNWRLPFNDGLFGQLDITAGHMLPDTTVEQMTSARFNSFPERNAANTAFGNGRRTGMSATYISPDFRFRWAHGLYTTTINRPMAKGELTYATRMIYEPQIGDWQFHLGVNGQERWIGERYRTRDYALALPASTVRTRLVRTGPIVASKERTIGLEVVAQRGPIHVVAEVQQMRLSGVRDLVTNAPLDTNPRFRTGYAELGWWVTGETRGFDNGKFGRTATRRPLGRGGFGGIALNIRHDIADLSDSRGGVPGGRQFIWLGSVVWQQNDFARTWLSFARGVAVDGSIGNRQPFSAITLRFGFDY